MKKKTPQLRLIVNLVFQFPCTINLTALAPLNPMQEFPFILIENQSHQEPILNEHQHTINNI